MFTSANDKNDKYTNDKYTKAANGVATLAHLGHGLNEYDLSRHAGITFAEASALLSGKSGSAYQRLYDDIRAKKEGH